MVAATATNLRRLSILEISPSNVVEFSELLAADFVDALDAD